MKDQFIKERIEEFEKILKRRLQKGLALEYPEVIDLVAPFFTQAYSAGETAMLEKVEGIVPIERDGENCTKKNIESHKCGICHGFNVCRSNMLTKLKKLKEMI